MTYKAAKPVRAIVMPNGINLRMAGLSFNKVIPDHRGQGRVLVDGDLSDFLYDLFVDVQRDIHCIFSNLAATVSSLQFPRKTFTDTWLQSSDRLSELRVWFSYEAVGEMQSFMVFPCIRKSDAAS